jgi:hypothetical protein
LTSARTALPIAADHVVLEGRRLQLCDAAGCVRAGFALDALEQVLVVRLASALVHGDEPFLVLQGAGHALTLPLGAAGALEQTLPALAPPGATLWRAEAENLPLAWRKRVLGVLPLFPLPRLALHDASTLPPWPRRGPHALVQLRSMIEGPADG